MESLKLPSIGGSQGGMLSVIGARHTSPFSGYKEKKHRSKHQVAGAVGDLDPLDVEKLAAKKRRKEEKKRRKLAAAVAAAEEEHAMGGTHGRFRGGGDMSSEFHRQHQVMSNSSPLHIAPHAQQQQQHSPPPKYKLDDALTVCGDGVMEEQIGFLGIAGEDTGRTERRVKKKKDRGDPEKELKRKKKQAKKAKKMEKAAIMLQKAFRAKFARAVAHRMR